MALPTSGAISLADIQTEFGGENPIGLNEYYAGGIYVSVGTEGTFGAVPASGAIDLRSFYGTNALPEIVAGTTFTLAHLQTGANSPTIELIGTRTYVYGRAGILTLRAIAVTATRVSSGRVVGLDPCTVTWYKNSISVLSVTSPATPAGATAEASTNVPVSTGDVLEARAVYGIYADTQPTNQQGLITTNTDTTGYTVLS